MHRRIWALLRYLLFALLALLFVDGAFISFSYRRSAHLLPIAEMYVARLTKSLGANSNFKTTRVSLDRGYGSVSVIVESDCDPDHSDALKRIVICSMQKQNMFCFVDDSHSPTFVEELKLRMTMRFQICVYLVMSVKTVAEKEESERAYTSPAAPRW